jgi:hypothetical protein
MYKTKQNLSINGKHILENININGNIKNYPIKSRQQINTFYKLWIEYTKTNNYGYLKKLISLSFTLGINSAIFEQISLVLSKYYLSLYNRI